MAIKEDFEKAAEEAKTLPADLPNEEKLALYGLFKQATVGDCDTSKPNIFDPKGRAKWDAWNGQKGKSSEDAMKEYIAKVADLKGEYGTA
eukprot:jgi/Pico_ML_1/51886/g18.t1